MGAGGEVLVEACVAGGVAMAFTVPGESFLGVLDALSAHRSIRTVATRHEGGASFMAAATGRLSGRPALAMATRAVGAANLAIGVHTAMQDSAPMIALLGQVGRRFRHREAFQETELTAMFRPLAKWTVEITEPDRIGELTAKAIAIATSGRPGPVVISVPEDVLAADAKRRPATAPVSASPAPADAALDAIVARLRTAARPAMLLGGGAAGAGEEAVRLAVRAELPVFAAWRRPDVFPNAHRLYLGQTGYWAPASVSKRLLGADYLLVVGCRLSEIASFGYRVPAGDWAHVDIDAAVLGQAGAAAAAPASVAVQAEAGAFLQALAERCVDLRVPPARKEANEADRARWEAEAAPPPPGASWPAATVGSAGAGDAARRFVSADAIAATVRSLLPGDAITTVDAGNFSGWVARYLRWNQPRSFLGPTSGAMGYGVPSAIAAKLHAPDRPVVAFAGDGGFLMTGAELETAVRENAPVVTIVFDNGQYGTIKMHQERAYPGRPVATSLGAVDFAGFTRALGGEGVLISHPSEFGDAFKAALTADRPVTIAIPTDPAILSVDSPR